MSDPLSNREIEDVLSSIRRLVAQGEPAQPKALHGGASEKLVLTPAFRVAPSAVAEVDPITDALEADTPGAPGAEIAPEPAEPMPAAQPQPEPAASVRPASEAPNSLEATIAELEAAISAYGGPFEPDGGDPVPLPRAFCDAAESVGEADAVDGAGEADALDGTGQASALDDAGQADAAESAEQAALPPDSAALVADAIARPAPAPLPVVEGPVADNQPVEPAGPVAAPAAWNVQPFAPARRPGPQREAPAAEPVAEPGEASQGDAPLLEDGEEDSLVLDEVLLRELVTDILREELQGALGQRITRNVRKLVRAEIARALASRDLG